MAMSKSLRPVHLSGLGCMMLASMLTIMGGTTAHAQTALADTPVYSTSNVPANLMLSLSVEFPTGTVGAYNNATNYTAYSAANPFLGYFDPAKCYDYSTSSPPGSTTSGYFVPIGAVSSTGSCLSVSGGTTTYHWSGNMLNWATMTALDEFRQALTGGNRVVDTTSSTVLIRSNLNSQSNTGNFANKTIGSGTNVAASTVIGDANYASLGTVYLESAAQGTTFVISNNSSFSNTGSTGSGGSTVNNIATTYNAEVQVCVPSLLEANCNSAHQTSDYVGAGVYNKPEGLIQQNYTKIRVGAAAYAFQYGTGAANGAVRALLRDNGPTTYNGYGARQTNTYSEWNATTGIFTANPDTADTKGTAPGGGSGNATQTGAINYLNQFGYANGYETNDTVADLYWAALAYLMHVPLDSSYTSGLTNSNSLDVAFPVFTGTTLNDPIQYTCQTNAILSIGDIHTWYDTRVPSSGGPTPSNTNQAPLAVVNGADAGGYVTALGNLPLIEKNGTTAASVTMAQLRYKGSSATTSTVVPAANQLGLTTEPNGTTNSTYNMAGLAYFAHTQEIRPDLVALQTGATFKHTVSTYTVDVLEPGAYDGTSGKEIYNPAKFNTSGGAAGPSMYWLAAKYGGFNDINNDRVPANPLTWHTNSSSGTALRPDNYFPGNQPTLIQSGLQQIFNNVASTATQSGAAPTVTPTRVLTNITAGTAPFYSPASGFPIFTTSYTPISWVGDVTGYVGAVTAGSSVSQVSGSIPWHAQLQLDTLTQAASKTGWNTGRRILTMNTATNVGIPFRYLSISPAQQVSLNSDTTLLNYLRGDQSNETSNFRARIHILGDIVDSQAVLVQGASSPSYTEAANPGYTNFSTSSAIANRQPVVYVGANDGMLHAFEADFLNPTTADPVTGGGSELFAYVPSLLFQGPNGTPSVDGLAALANLNGVSTNNYSHHFYVDQTPQVSDVDFTLTGNGSATPASTASTANWHTLLVGGLGKGGKGFYALDVTTVPAAVNTTTSVADESALVTGNNKTVLWEFTDADMGYSYGAPLIVKTRKYGWVVVLTSGYNNTASGQDGHGVLYIVNAQTGALLQKIDTGVGTTTNPAGLTQATGYTQNVGDGTIDQVYAGDLLGNVWRFDLSEPAISGGVATGPYPAPTLFATLADPSGVAQPITTAPRIETDIDSTGLGTLRWVFVGTGQFLSTSDLTSTQQQTMYALRDGTGSNPATAGLPRSRTAASPYNLVPNPLTSPLSLTDSSAGWYYDLPGTAGSNGGTERIVVNPDSAAGIPIIAWASITPSSDPCSLLGSIYAVDFSTGQTVIYGSGTTLVASIHTGTATNGAQLVQLPNGTYSILYGQTGALPSTLNIKQPTPGNLLYRVNWREILQ
jgi:type IV pilus assembly protein PilY1